MTYHIPPSVDDLQELRKQVSDVVCGEGYAYDLCLHCIQNAQVMQCTDNQESTDMRPRDIVPSRPVQKDPLAETSGS